jgi:hypothetical protein
MPIFEGPGITSKDDPLHSSTRAGNRTVWLDRASSDEARDKYWSGYLEYLRGLEQPTHPLHESADKHTWDIAWAATIAAHSYIWEGRIGPE